MTQKRVRELRDLVIDEVSLVDRGANQHAHVTIAKNYGEEGTEMEFYDEGGNPVDVDSLEIGEVVFDEGGNAYQYTDENDDDDYEDSYDEEFAEVGKAMPKFFADAAGRAAGFGQRATTGVKAGAGRAKQWGQGAAGNVRGAAGRVGSNVRGTAGRVGSNVRDAGTYAGVVGLEGMDRVGRAGRAAGGWANANRGAIAAGGGGLAVGGGAGYLGGRNDRVRKSYADVVREELSKALSDTERDEVISKAIGTIETLSKRADDAYALAESERDARVLAEFVEVAKSYNAPVTPEALGATLKHVTELLPPEDHAVIKTLLGALPNDTFTEVGVTGYGSNSDVYSQVEAVVDGLVAKSGLSREEMVTEVFSANPSAYDEYLSERRNH